MEILRTNKFESLSVTAPSPGVTAEDLRALAGGLMGVYVETAATGVQVGFLYKAEKIVLPKKNGTGKTIAQGAYIYYSPMDNLLYGASATSRRKCGICLVAAAADDTTVEVMLDGTMGITAQTS